MISSLLTPSPIQSLHYLINNIRVCIIYIVSDSFFANLQAATSFLNTSLTIVPKQSYSLYSLNVIIIKKKKNYMLNVNWE